jgi:hypothetical protein
VGLDLAWFWQFRRLSSFSFKYGSGQEPTTKIEAKKMKCPLFDQCADSCHDCEDIDGRLGKLEAERLARQCCFRQEAKK